MGKNPEVSTLCTTWKFLDFLATQVLFEINFGHFEAPFFGDSYCVFEDIYGFLKVRRSILDHMELQRKKWSWTPCMQVLTK